MGRNELICWVEDAKRPATRAPHRADGRRDRRGQAPPLLLAGRHPPRRQAPGPLATGDAERKRAPRLTRDALLIV
ncbi:hypothetical protein [uncultured Sphingomonas sp.]|uniref:hypothetical protein n=1 Tax=uncultured Sphingomonas sp. TaxID=158754 RepID=UPI0025DC9668|nr:hypothetical protein [uncultured Sphingomonas sp.]